MDAENNPLLNDAIRALEEGNSAEAREIITRLLKAEPNNPEYWLWMSAAVETKKERRYCLQKALAADPDYEPARRGLVLLGELPAEEVPPTPIPNPFAWRERLKPQKTQGQEATKQRVPPKRVMIGIGVLALFMLLSWAAWGAWQKLRPVHLATPQLLINTTFTPTPSPTTTPTPVNPLTLGKPTPLEKLLVATYTPTPLPMSTPHKVEAFRLGMRAMQEKRWDAAINYFQQTLRDESAPDADIHFYMGEIYRQTGRWGEAEKAYKDALKADPQMAAALVGLAQVYMHNGKDKDALTALNQAAQAQPNYGLTFLTRAKWYLAHNKPKKALADLAQADKLLPGSPLVPLYRAEAYLALKDNEHALEQAKLANQRDITLLEAYKIIGEASLALGNYGDATQYLRTYLTYAQNDSEGYLLLAQAYHELGKEKEAIAAAEKSVEKSPTFESYRKLGEFYLEAGRPADAIKALQQALRRKPDDFQTKIDLVKALLANGEAGDAFQILHKLEPSLKDQKKLYILYYWRAKTLTALSDQGPQVKQAAIRDWQRILNAPDDLVSAEWRKEAQQQLNLLLTPQPSPTP